MKRRKKTAKATPYETYTHYPDCPKCPSYSVAKRECAVYYLPLVRAPECPVFQEWENAKELHAKERAE